MAEIIVVLIFIIPAMLGLAEIIHTVKMFLLSSSVPCKRILIIFPDDGDFQRQITKTAEERSWRGKDFVEKVLVSEENISEKNIDELNVLVKKYDFEIYKREV